MPDGESPAAVAEAPTATTEAPVETPAPSAPASKAEESSTPAAPSAPAEPDIDALLGDDTTLEKFLKHPRAEQRIKSVRKADTLRQAQELANDMIRQRDAETQSKIDQMRQEQKDDSWWQLIEREAEAARMEGRTEADWVRQMRPELQQRRAEREAAKAEEAVLQRLMPRVKQEADILTNRQVIGIVKQAVSQADKFVKGLTLSEEDQRVLDPLNEKHTDGTSYYWASVQLLATKLAKQMAPEIAKQEAEAIVQERLAERRTSEKAPVTLPPGEGAASDTDFLKEFGAGNNNDFKRAREVLKGIGISL